MKNTTLSTFNEDLYNESIEHRNQHKCGGYPYADGDFLNQIVKIINAKSVLEIGTAVGYSAYCFAADNDVNVITIDMVEEHHNIAEENWQRFNVTNQIEMKIGRSQDILPTIEQKFDIVFFDGFAPNPDEVSEYSRLVGDKGLLITTNHSWNNTTTDFLNELEKNGLEHVLKTDTAFSSREKNKIKMCVELWEKKRDTHSD